uniref:Deoxyuridine 5'-triphosphate nucleotidohydrolase n=1 Tax=Lygus hesperus TaxID=30085 RepID=A0A0A9ZBI7_LYGHE
MWTGWKNCAKISRFAGRSRNGSSEFPNTRPFSCSSSSSSTQIQTKMPGEVAVLRFVKLTENAHAPSKGSELAAGYDLKSAYDYTIPARGKELVKTDIQIQVPEGCYGRVAPRSGLAWKHHIDVGAGVIDADYTGNVGIVMFNHGPEDFKVKAGDRVAQLICEKICYPDIQEVKTVDETKRGAGGFGSTGQS